MPTISPNYQQKVIPNPYYIIDEIIDRVVIKFLKKDYDLEKTEIVRYKCVDKIETRWTEIKTIDNRGKYFFQVEFFDTAQNTRGGKKSELIPFYLKLTAKNVKGHYGMTSRKDSTASSNVNEFLTVYFLKHKTFTTAKAFMKFVSTAKTATGVYTGEETPVTHIQLKTLIDKDETPDRDIEIGYKNSIAVAADLKANKQKWERLYWTPRQKPAGIGDKNPSDVIVKTTGGCYVGYSNKISSGGKDETPKFNTNMYAFFGKLGGTKQPKDSVDMMDKAWTAAMSKLKKNSASYKAAENVNIKKEKPSETISQAAFANAAKSFRKDKLDFYTTGFYYHYREALIKSMIKYLSDLNNLIYFLNTIGFYTFGTDTNTTPCPYKLLVGSPTKGAPSTIKEVSKDETNRELLLNKDKKALTNFRSEFTSGTQSFKLYFNFFHHKVEIPITMRTRAAGGWSGKSLYITSPGIKME